MARRMVLAMLFLVLGGAAVAKTHHDMFDVPCKTLWPAVKDTLRNSGKYGIIGIDNEEMTASYNIGGYMGGKRTNSLVLNSKGNQCELQVQTSYSGLVHNDEGDLKDRIEQSLKKLQNTGASTQPAGASASASANAEGGTAPSASDGKSSDPAARTPKQ